MHLRGVYTEEVRIPSGDAALAGTLLSPSGSWPRPCMVLVSGSGANDRDETVCGHTPFRVIADFFCARGFAVLRCDDRGVGRSTGDSGRQDFEGSIADVLAISRWLGTHPAADAERLVLFGHSEGGLIAASAGPDVNARAVVMLAGPCVPVEGMLHEQAKALSLEAGSTAAQIAHERRMNEEVFALARTKRARSAVEREIELVILRYLSKWPDAPTSDEETLKDNARFMASVVSAPAYRSLLQLEPATILRRFTGRLLALYGGRDIQVQGVANAAAFQEIFAGARGAEVRLYPNHNHLFQPAGTGSISEYEVLPPGPDDQVLQDIADWLAAAELGPAADRWGA